MGDMVKQPGRLRPAPENFLSEEQVKAVGSGRRDFLRKSFLAAGAALAAPMAARAASEGDINILENPAWTTSLGMPVATNPYGMPSTSSRRPACISSAITRAGMTSIRPSIA